VKSELSKDKYVSVCLRRVWSTKVVIRFRKFSLMAVKSISSEVLLSPPSIVL
jgi:hypothetical protein